MLFCFFKKRIKLKLCYEWALQQTCPGVDVMSDRTMHASRLHYLFIKVLWKKKIKYSRIHIRNIYKPSDTKVGVRGSQIYKSRKHFQSRQSVINKQDRDSTESRSGVLIKVYWFTARGTRTSPSLLDD